MLLTGFSAKQGVCDLMQALMKQRVARKVMLPNLARSRSIPVRSGRPSMHQEKRMGSVLALLKLEQGKQ